MRKKEETDGNSVPIPTHLEVTQCKSQGNGAVRDRRCTGSNAQCSDGWVGRHSGRAHAHSPGLSCFSEK